MIWLGEAVPRKRCGWRRAFSYASVVRAASSWASRRMYERPPRAVRYASVALLRGCPTLRTNGYKIMTLEPKGMAGSAIPCLLGGRSEACCLAQRRVEHVPKIGAQS